MTENWHGTPSGYNNHGCRCDDCKEAKSAVNLEYRLRNRAKLAAWHRRNQIENKELINERRRLRRQARRNEGDT